MRRFQVLPGKTVACLGEKAEASALARLVADAGGSPIAVGHEIVRAHGLRRVEGVTTTDGGAPAKHRCDLIAMCGPVGPSSELARAAGATTRWDERAQLFVVDADEAGRSGVSTLWIAGELCGPLSSRAAEAQGARVAAALLDGARP